MSIFSFISAFLFSFYIFTGVYALSRNYKSRIHILFFIITIALAYWCVSSVYIYSADSAETASFWVQTGAPGIIIFIPLILHFSIELTGIFKFTRFWYLIYLPQIIAIISNFYEPIFFSEIRIHNGVPAFMPNFGSFWHQIYSFSVFLYLGIAIFILFRWYFTAQTIREKKQSVIISVSLALSLILITAEEILLPIFYNNLTPGLGPITFILFICGIFFAILRYRFLDITPSLVTADILAGIDESVMLVNAAFRIKAANRKTEELTGSKETELTGRNILDYISEREKFTDSVNYLLREKIHAVNVKFHYSDNSSLHLMDAKVSAVADNLGDIVGFLIMARETGGDEFVKQYRISKREMEIILAVLAGNTNKKIAEIFSISEVTVKSHITNIYNKLAVDNRIQLLELLKRYNITP